MRGRPAYGRPPPAQSILGCSASLDGRGAVAHPAGSRLGLPASARLLGGVPEHARESPRLDLGIHSRTDGPNQLELGTSGGLNLFWDQYQYCYQEGCWGEGTAELQQRVDVQRRRSPRAHPGRLP
ncbi:MAG: DUF2332 family protein [Acidobacteria bacterium]|nr:MAG: DUF2332 family protein [Acidobacteriota bacterium]